MGIFGKLFGPPNVEELASKKDIEGLIKALKDKDKAVRKEATEVLGKIGEPVVEPLIQALKDKDKAVREEAAEILGKIGDARAVEPLIQALEDEDRYVLMKAAEALGDICDARAVEPLVQYLKDEDRYVRMKAAGALGDICDARAVESLIQALKDRSATVREEAAEALDKLGWKPADDTGKAFYLVAKKEWYKSAKLGELAVEPLIQALKDRDLNVREAAKEALGKIKAKKS